MQIAFARPSAPSGGTLVLPVFADRTLSSAAAAVDAASGGFLVRAMATVPKFTGRKDEILSLPLVPEAGAARVVLYGFGAADAVDAAALQKAGGTLVAHLNQFGDTSAVIRTGGLRHPAGTEGAAAAEIAFGAVLRGWRFDRYRTTEKPEAKPSLASLTLETDDEAAARDAYGVHEALSAGIVMARELVTEPPNVLYPESFAERVKALEADGLEVEILDEKQLGKLGMGALLGDGQGSARKTCVAVMQWKGGGKKKGRKPVAFIGKGVTFDTGGISLKPGQGMEEMKFDMAGAAAVVGVMRALALRKAKVDAVGVIGLVENMPDGEAQRPGDVVKSMSGQTIEIHNTDAEGRLVLADVLWYTQDRFKPQFMVNLATLTGAIIVALGSEHAGLFSNDDTLSERLTAAGRAVDEKLWRLPLADAYDRQIDSDIADVKNIAGSRDAGSIMGAQFLQRFVNRVPWAHLDIAGTAWSRKDSAIIPKGATAFGVRLLDRLVADHYEG
jgi:leucyl aminopeptidase